MTLSRLVLLLAASSTAFAYSGTYPVVAWTSHHSALLESLPERLEPTFDKGSLFEHLAGSESLCEHDAVIIIDHPGLHASDLRSLSPRAHISRTLSSSLASRQYPYVPDSLDFEVLAFANRMADRCRSGVVHYSLGDDAVIPSGYSNYIISMKMPGLVLSGKDRKEFLAEQDELLAAEVTSLADTFPKHIILLAGSPSPFAKRQEDSHPHRPILDLADGDQPLGSNANTTLPTGGILKRYQLLTPALISSLLVSLFVIFPLVFVGVKALASIQSPIRLDTPKGILQDKKNQ